jgi:hypothetical protein
MSWDATFSDLVLDGRNPVNDVARVIFHTGL